jgi:hypothetical protein
MTRSRNSKKLGAHGDKALEVLKEPAEEVVEHVVEPDVDTAVRKALDDFQPLRAPSPHVSGRARASPPACRSDSVKSQRSSHELVLAVTATADAGIGSTPDHMGSSDGRTKRAEIDISLSVDIGHAGQSAFSLETQHDRATPSGRARRTAVARERRWGARPRWTSGGPVRAGGAAESVGRGAHGLDGVAGL